MSAAPLGPGTTIGIVGGGQLGRMLAQAARQHGYGVAVFTGGGSGSPAGVLADREFSLNEDNAAACAEICRRLDGVPLAIELAAARMSALSPHQIAERLDNRFALLTKGTRTALPRQQTLRAAIDWSYELLAPDEQRLLRCLSVFRGGFTLEAVQALWSDGEERDQDALELLTHLLGLAQLSE